MLSALTRVFATAVVMFAAATSAQAEFVANQDYLVLEPSLPVMADGRVHVEEVFWYGCPHCYTLEKHITPWKKQLASDVTFTGVPAMFGRPWVAHAQLFYVVDVLGVQDKVHDAIFDAYHQNRQALLSRDDQRLFLMAKANISEADFNKAYDSFAVKSRLKQADQRVRASGLSGVPAIIVQGKYVITPNSAGGQANMLAIADFLIEKERAELKKP